jgi:hypothetical protein
MWFLQSLPLDTEVIHLVTTVIVPKSRANRKQLLQSGDYTHNPVMSEMAIFQQRRNCQAIRVQN